MLIVVEADTSEIIENARIANTNSFFMFFSIFQDL
jgi:hypothetical protein